MLVIAGGRYVVLREGIRSSGTPGGVLRPEYAVPVSSSVTWMMIAASAHPAATSVNQW
jgi:hypothetical protein